MPLFQQLKNKVAHDIFLQKRTNYTLSNATLNQPDSGRHTDNIPLRDVIRRTIGCALT